MRCRRRPPASPRTRRSRSRARARLTSLRQRASVARTPRAILPPIRGCSSAPGSRWRPADARHRRRSRNCFAQRVGSGPGNPCAGRAAGIGSACSRRGGDPNADSRRDRRRSDGDRGGPTRCHIAAERGRYVHLLHVAGSACGALTRRRLAEFSLEVIDRTGLRSPPSTSCTTVGSQRRSAPSRPTRGWPSGRRSAPTRGGPSSAVSATSSIQTASCSVLMVQPAYLQGVGGTSMLGGGSRPATSSDGSTPSPAAIFRRLCRLRLR